MQAPIDRPPPANLEKRIKRHVLAPEHLFYAVTALGLEDLCVRELEQFSEGLKVAAKARGGVFFSGRIQALYQANLYLRTVGRILLRLIEFKATNFRQLEKQISEVAWALYLPWGAAPACKVAAHQSRLYHSQAVAQHAAQAIGAYWQDQGAELADAQGQTLYIRIDQDIVTVSLDSTGPNLYQRGIKTHTTQAPLRETLAAAILQLAGYDPTLPLLDPMCGAGTFSLEAALLAMRMAPGMFRDFAFMQWPAFRPRQWQYLKTMTLNQSRTPQQPLIFASDLNAAACNELSACLTRNHLNTTVQVLCQDFFALRPPERNGKMLPKGLMVLNPPYGLRLKPDQDMESLYRRIGAKLAADFKGWRIALLVPQQELIAVLALKAQQIALFHGGLPLTLLVGRVG